MEEKYSFTLREVTDKVIEYFKESSLDYEPIAVLPTNTSYLFKVLAKYAGASEMKKDTYAVWNCFNMSTICMNYGHYDMSFEDAYELLTTGDVKELKYKKLFNIAKSLSDKVQEEIGDEDEIYDYFSEILSLTDKEMEQFGVSKPKKYKVVEVVCNFTIEVLIPQEEYENDYSYDEYLRDAISDGVNHKEYICVTEEDISKAALINYPGKYEDLYGYDEVVYE